jgi:hypothetical protein
MPTSPPDSRFEAMRIGREIEKQCPRCRMVAVRAAGHQDRCTHCGAKLVVTKSPSEAFVRAYLYGERAEPRVPLATAPTRR